MTLFAIFSAGEGGAIPHVVPQRFSWFAALLPPLYAVRYALFAPFILFFAVLGVVLLLSTWIGGMAAFWLYAAIALWIGFEAAEFRAAALRGRGLALAGNFVADSGDGALAAFLIGAVR